MSEQTSVTQAVFPGLRYRDAPAAMDWLEAVLGFERRAVYAADDGAVHHAELALDGVEGAMVMLGSEPTEGDGRLAQGAGGSSVYIVVSDPDARWARAVAAGAEVARELRDEDYGSRGFSVRDPEGNLWSLGTYQPWASG
jgi:uncharacterized glyoxalase superfamily protein PhnB